MSPSSIKWLLDEFDLSYKENSNSYIFECPTCQEYKFYLNKKEGYFICFKCADAHNVRGKSPERALAILTNKPLAVIRAKLNTNRIVYSSWEEDEDEEIVEIRQVNPEIQWPLDIYPIDHKFSERGLSYLESRNISLDIANKYQLRYYPEQQRVIFPLIRDEKLYGWQARTVVNNPIKMLSSIGIPRNSMFMFEDNLKNSKHILLTEGPVDAIRGHLCGGNIASMGKIVTNKQIELLKNWPQKDVYLGLDPDAGLETERLIKKMYNYKDLYQLEVTKKDIGEMTYEAVFEAFKTAKKVNTGTLYVYI